MGSYQAEKADHDLGGAAEEMAALPELTKASVRSPLLMDVGATVNGKTQQQAIHALASAKREGGGDLLADLAEAILHHASQSQGQLFQDVFALFISGFRRNGYFVEVGTGDGKLISNTFLLEKEFGWDGIVVEPNETFSPALEKHRSCRIASDCVFDVTGRAVQFICAQSPEFSRIRRPDYDLYEVDEAGGSVEVTLTTTSLNDLLERESSPERIDYISIDVEGAEFEILQTFDFDKYKVECFTIEHNWTANRDRIFNLMEAKGFLRVFEHLSQWDDWYVRRDVLERFPAAGELMKTSDELDFVPPNADRYVSWSLEAIARGELDVAEALCRRALELDPVCGAAYRTLGEVAIKQGRRSVALEHWRSAVATDPADFWARVGLAELLASRGAISEAVSHLREASALNVDTAQANKMLEELVPKAAGHVDQQTEQ